MNPYEQNPYIIQGAYEDAKVLDNIPWVIDVSGTGTCACFTSLKAAIYLAVQQNYVRFAVWRVLKTYSQLNNELPQPRRDCVLVFVGELRESSTADILVCPADEYTCAVCKFSRRYYSISAAVHDGWAVTRPGRVVCPDCSDA